MIYFTKIVQIQNTDSVYNLVNPSPHTVLIYYVYFYAIIGPSGNSLRSFA